MCKLYCLYINHQKNPNKQKEKTTRMQAMRKRCTVLANQLTPCRPREKTLRTPPRRFGARLMVRRSKSINWQLNAYHHSFNTVPPYLTPLYPLPWGHAPLCTCSALPLSGRFLADWLCRKCLRAANVVITIACT